MAKDITEITYDRQEDILSLWSGKESQVSIEVGDFIVDVDNKGHVTGLEIMNASDNLEVSPEIIGHVEKASLSVLYKPTPSPCKNCSISTFADNPALTNSEIRLPSCVILGLSDSAAILLCSASCALRSFCWSCAPKKISATRDG